MISIKVEGFDEAMRMLDPKRVVKAARLAINEAAKAGRTEAGRQIRNRWNIAASKVNAEVRNIKMAGGADLTAIIQAKGRPISLTYFGAKEVRNVSGGVLVQTRKSGRIVSRTKAARGVTVKILRGQTTRLPQAFIATTRSGYIGVFQRSGRARLPVENRAVITIASMFQQEQVQRPTLREITARWNARFRHHLDREMR